MSELLIVNPGKKKKKKASSKKGKVKYRTKTKTVVKYRNKASNKPKKRKVHRNPKGTFMGVDIMSVGGGVAIVAGSKLLPGYLAKMGLPVPQAGYMKYAVDLVSGLGISWAVKKFLKQRAIAQKGSELVVAMVLTEIINDLLLGQGGVAGLFGLDKAGVYMERGAPTELLSGGLGAGVYQAAYTGGSRTSRFKNRMGDRVQLG